MRYFEITRPPTRHTLADVEQRDAGESRGGRLQGGPPDAGGARLGGNAAPQSRLGCVDSLPSDRDCNFARTQDLISQQSRRQHLSPRRSQ